MIHFLIDSRAISPVTPHIEALQNTRIISSVKLTLANGMTSYSNLFGNMGFFTNILHLKSAPVTLVPPKIFHENGYNVVFDKESILLVSPSKTLINMGFSRIWEKFNLILIKNSFTSFYRCYGTNFINPRIQKFKNPHNKWSNDLEKDNNKRKKFGYVVK